MSALPQKADIAEARRACPLCARSGHHTARCLFIRNVFLIIEPPPVLAKGSRASRRHHWRLAPGGGTVPGLMKRALMIGTYYRSRACNDKRASVQ